MAKNIVIIAILALVVRLWQISDVPWSVNWDEAAFGYNAYSLLHTGRDEYGTPMPLEFKSIGDYKAPMYIYMLVPAVALFDLNEFGIRMMPSLMGSISVVLLFVIVVSLTGNRTLAGAVAVVLALSPWHLQFSRAGADVAISSAWVMLGVALFVRQKTSLAMVAFSGSMYAYYSERFFVPLFMTALFVIARRRLFPGAMVFGLCLLPIAVTLVSPGQQSKIFNTTLLSYSIPNTETDPKVVVYARMFMDRYLAHFSPSFLFIRGLEDNRQRIEGMGMMYLSDAILVVWGLLVWKNKLTGSAKYSLVLFAWLVLAPLPAAITKDPVHARRAFNMVYPLSIVAGIGLWNMLGNTKKGFVPLGVTVSVLGVMLWSIGFYALSYYRVTPMLTFKGAGGWQYGYKQLVAKLADIEETREIVVDTSYQGPYIFFLMYQKYSPAKYHHQARLVYEKPEGLGEGAGYDQFVFRDVNWREDRDRINKLFVAPPEKFPVNFDEHYKYIDSVYFPDGSEAFRIVATI